jgi:TRAP-type C4-dicarboxylate transport system substrate-binding protein
MLVQILCALILIVAPVSAQTLEWTLATEYPATSIVGEGLQHFAGAIGQASGGRITAKPSFDSALGVKSAEMPAAVASGKVTVGDAFGGALGGVHPVFLLPSLPFLATSTGDARWLYDAARPIYEQVFADKGQKLLYATPWPASGLWAKKPIVQRDDIRGLAIRVYDVTGVDVLRAVGAAPANLSFADTMPRLKDGSIAAVLSSGDGGAGRRLWEYLPHFTEVTYAVPLSFTTVNFETWSRLSTDLQRAVTEAATSTEERQWQIVATRLDENYSRMRANGVTITTTISSELRQALTEAGRNAVEAWQTSVGATGQEILARFRRMTGRP